MATASDFVIPTKFTFVNSRLSTPVDDHIAIVGEMGPPFAMRLREIKEERERDLGRTLTQDEIAKAAGVAGRAAVNHWLNGLRIPSGLPLIMLAEYFAVSPRWLADGIGPKRVPFSGNGRQGLEFAVVVDGMEMTREAVLVAQAWMALPLNERERFRSELVKQAKQHGYREPEIVQLVSKPKGAAKRSAK